MCFLRLTIDSCHKPDLMALLFLVTLINTNCVSPKKSVGCRESQAVQEVEQIDCSVEANLINVD